MVVAGSSRERGTEPSPEQAAKWFGNAAKQGYAKAQSHLATRYATGDGVTRDDVEALKWAILAARQGHQVARETTELVRARLTPAEIAEAARRADTFRPVKSLNPN